MPTKTTLRVGLLALLILLLPPLCDAVSNEGCLIVAATLVQDRQEPSRAARVFYVATNGNEAWSGSASEPNQGGTDGPFATLTRARDAIRKLPGRDEVTGPVIVYVRGGTYALSRPVVFTPVDSGTKASPSIYRSYPDETPVLSGGRTIEGWKRVDTRGDLPQAGVGAPPSQENLWMAEVPGIREGHWYFRQLFTDGKRRQRARSPNRGFFIVDGLISADHPAQFRFNRGDIDPEWIPGGKAEVVALLRFGGFRLLLKGVDARTLTATLSTRRQPWGGRDRNQMYWVENMPQALDTPGEWYLAHRNGVLYYRSMPDENMPNLRAVAPFLRQLICLEGDPGAEHNIVYWRDGVLLHGKWEDGVSKE